MAGATEDVMIWSLFGITGSLWGGIYLKGRVLWQFGVFIVANSKISLTNSRTWDVRRHKPAATLLQDTTSNQLVFRDSIMPYNRYHAQSWQRLRTQTPLNEQMTPNAMQSENNLRINRSRIKICLQFLQNILVEIIQLFSYQCYEHTGIVWRLV